MIQADDVPQTSPARTQVGQLWQLGRHRLAIGDATDPQVVAQLMGDQRASLVFTDPPYGVAYTDTLGRSIENDKLTGRHLQTFLVSAFRNAVAHVTPDSAWFVWHASRFAGEVKGAMEAVGVDVKQQIIWVKGVGTPNTARVSAPQIGRSHWRFLHEPCWYGGTGQPYNAGDRTTTTVWTVPRPTTGTVHPTQKPVNLVFIALLNSSRPGDIVLDLFGGSGSTLIAAQQRDRTAHLVELDTAYADAIIERWEQFTGGEAELIHA